jgi:hypothetical protein
MHKWADCGLVVIGEVRSRVRNALTDQFHMNPTE